MGKDMQIKGQRYSPEQTAMIRMETVSAIVEKQTGLLQRATTKTDLNDIDAVEKIVNNYMQQCAELGCIPNFEGCAASLGYSRRGLYDRIERHPESDVAVYLDRVRTAWASMRQMAADRGAADVTMSIFILLNSSLGFTNQHSVEISQPQNPLEPGLSDTAAARQRILSALPEDDGIE